MPTASGQSRRMTLGVVDGNQKSRNSGKPPRSRVSMIPRVGRENQVPKSPGIHSHTQASLRRRSGVGAENGNNNGNRQSILPSGTLKKDPRPISDKSYQQECIKKLLTFLHQHGYDSVTQKSLSRPSGKDFANIVTFMLRLIDPNFQDGTAKFEDEVAMNFKAIGYPFSITKTSLVAAGSPHTWPTLLAALTWLMEHIQCIEHLLDKIDKPEDIDSDAGKPFETLEQLEQKTDEAFFTYLSLAYTAFLNGDAELTEELEGRLADRFEQDDVIIEHDIERVTDLNAQIVEKMSHLTKDTEDLQSLNEKREDYETDLEQFHDLIRQMDEHITGLKQKIDKQAKDLENTDKKINTLNAHVEELKEVISKQEYSVSDIRKMQNEQKGAEEAIERALALKDKRAQALIANEEQLVSLFEKLESVAAEYNSEISKVASLSVVSEKCVHMKTLLNKNPEQERDQTQLLGIDLRSIVLPALFRSKDEYIEMTTDTQYSYQEALIQKEAIGEALAAAVSNSKSIEKRKMQSLEALVIQQKSTDGNLAACLKEIEIVESKAAALRDPAELEEHMAQYERQCTQLEALREKHQQENIAKKKKIQEEIEVACRMIYEFEEYLQMKKNEVGQYCTRKVAETSQLRITENQY